MVCDRAIGVASIGRVAHNYTIPCGSPDRQDYLNRIVDFRRKFASSAGFARGSVFSTFAGVPLTNGMQQCFEGCPIQFGVIRIENKSFVIGSRIGPGDWFPVHKQVVFKFVGARCSNELIEFHDMSEIRRINEQTVRDSMTFAGSSEQLVRSLAGLAEVNSRLRQSESGYEFMGQRSSHKRGRNRRLRKRLLDAGNNRCPICLSEFNRLDVLAGTEVTSEHAPPKALGGVPICLTCNTNARK